MTGGYNTGAHSGIFVESVVKNSNAYKKGLKRGDQILEVNGENFTHAISLDRALEYFKKAYLQIIVKSNFLAFKEVTASGGKKPSIEKPQKKKDDRNMTEGMRELSIQSKHKQSKAGKFSGWLSKMLRNPTIEINHDDLDARFEEHDEDFGLEDAAIPEHSLKIYKADHQHRFLLVNKNTTAREVVMLSLKEFGITDCSTNYALFEVSVNDNGFIRTSRMPDPLPNLAQRLKLATRYYIKNVAASQQLVPEEISGQLLAEASVNLLQLTPEEIATQLMVEDFTIFRQIEQTEYVDHIFGIKSKFGKENLEAKNKNGL